MPAGRLSEQRDEHRLRELRDLTDVSDPALVQLARGHGPDAPEPLHGQRVEKGQLAIGRHEEEAVGLGHAARHLGEKLRPGDADRDGQADPVEHVVLESPGDLDGCAGDPSHAVHVEERLVDRQALDERRRVVEHLVHRLARLAVGREAGWNHDRLRAEAPRLPATHRRAHAVRLRLVARREDDASADDHRSAAQPRIVPLLDGREERVEVGVEDLRLS